MADVVKTLTIRGKAEGFEDLTAAIDRVTQAESRLGQAAQEAESRMQRAGAGAVTQTSSAQTRVLSVSREYDRLVRSVDAAANSQAKMERATSIAGRALAQGRITVEEHARTLDLARTRYGALAAANENLAKSNGLSRASFLELGHAAKATFEQLAAGASVGRIALQQGTSAVQALSLGSGGLTGLLRSIPAPFLVGGGIGAAVGGTLFAASRAQTEEIGVQRGLLGAGRGSGLTQEDIARLSGDPLRGGAGGLAVPVAREIATGLASTGNATEQNIASALKLTRDLSATLDMSFRDTGSLLKDLFTSPLKQFDALNEKLHFATANDRELVKQFVDQGKASEAARVALDALATSTGSYDKLTSTAGKGFDLLKTGLRDVGDYVSHAALDLVRGTEKIAQAQESVADRVAAAEKRQADAVKAATEDQVRQLKLRADAVTIEFERENLIARRNPLEQGIIAAQRQAGVAPPLTEAERLARSKDSPEVSAARRSSAALIERQVTERNSIDLSKQFTEQMRASTLTMGAEAAAIGKSVSESERYRFEAAARIQAGQGGKAISQEIEAQIRREAAAYGQLAEALARAKLGDQLRFDRAQLGRDQGDAAIASQLRSSGLGDIADPANQAAVAQMRLNSALSETKDIAGSSLKGFISDLRAGKSGAEALSNAFGRIGDKLLDRTIDQALSGLFKAGTAGADGGVLGKVFGGGLGQSAITAPVANVQGGVVNVTGGAGGLPGSGQGSTLSNGGTAPLSQVETRQLGSVTGQGAGGIVGVVRPDGAIAPVSLPGGGSTLPVEQGATAAQLSLPYSVRNPSMDSLAAAVTARDAARFGPDADQQLVSSMGPSLLERAKAMGGTDRALELGQSAQSAATSLEGLSGSTESLVDKFGGLGNVLSQAGNGSGGGGGFSLGGLGGGGSGGSGLGGGEGFFGGEAV